MALTEVSVGERLIQLGQAYLFVVIRDGASWPGPTDWEVNVASETMERLTLQEYPMELMTMDDQRLTGSVIVQLSESTRHLFRGVGNLQGPVGYFNQEPSSRRP